MSLWRCWAQAGQAASGMARTLRDHGIIYLCRRIIRKIWLACAYWALFVCGSAFRRGRTFGFRGERRLCFYRRDTWYNERAIEIPIILKLMEGHEQGKTLEVGNVLSRYFRREHDVLDKYERAPGVINEDAASYSPGKQYDLIVSISTLEHVGCDETPKEPMKPLVAIQNLRGMLTAGGVIVATWALGWNESLDRLLREGKLPISGQHFFKRISFFDWTEIGFERLCAEKVEYNRPYFDGNYLAVVMIGK